MKIPIKITKRQYTAFNKRNLKEIQGIISDANHDYLLIAENLAENTNCFESVDKIDHYREMTHNFKIELNKEFKYFITTRNKIFKAYNRGLNK